MPQPSDPPHPPDPGAEPPATTADLGHPRGTLALVVVYGLLFGLGWLALYLGRFLPHGAPHP